MKLHEIDFHKRIKKKEWKEGVWIVCDGWELRYPDGKTFDITLIDALSGAWEYFEEEKPKIENRVLTFYRYTYFDLGRKEFTQSPWTTEHWPVSMFISSSRNLIEVETKKVAMAIPSKGGIEFKAAE